MEAILRGTSLPFRLQTSCWAHFSRGLGDCIPHMLHGAGICSMRPKNDPALQVNISCMEYMGMLTYGSLMDIIFWIQYPLPSGKHTKNYGKIHHFQCVNLLLFQWSFSIAMLSYQRVVIRKLIINERFGSPPHLAKVPHFPDFLWVLMQA